MRYSWKNSKLPELLDEPSAGLSPVRQDETFIRTRRINKAGL